MLRELRKAPWWVKLILAAVVGFIVLGIVGSLLPEDAEEQAAAAPAATAPTATPVPAEPAVEPTVEPTATPEPQPTATPEPEPTVDSSLVVERHNFGLHFALLAVQENCRGYPSAELFTQCRQVLDDTLSVVQRSVTAPDFPPAELPPNCVKVYFQVLDVLEALGPYLDVAIAGGTHPQYLEAVAQLAIVLYSEDGHFSRLHANIDAACEP